MPRTATPTISVGLFMEEPNVKEVSNLDIEAKKYQLVVPVTQDLYDGMIEAMDKEKDHALSNIILDSVENKTAITLVVENGQMEDELGEMEVPVGKSEKSLSDISSVSFEQKGRGRTNVFRKAAQLLGEEEDSLVYAFGDVDESALEFAVDHATVLDAKGNEIFESGDEDGDDEGDEGDDEGDEGDGEEDGEINIDDVDFDNLDDYETDDLRAIAEALGMEVRSGQRRQTLIPAIEEFVAEGGGEGSSEDVDDDTIAAIVEGVTAALKPMLDKVIKAAQSKTADNGGTVKRSPGRPKKVTAEDDETPKRGPGRPKKAVAAPAKKRLARR